MARVKGCVNDKCLARQKKITYAESEEFCSKCGQRLSYVCKKCYTPLESAGKLCVRCQADKDDRNDKRNKWLIGIGSTAAAVTVGALTKGKDIVKRIPKIK